MKTVADIRQAMQDSVEAYVNEIDEARKAMKRSRDGADYFYEEANQDKRRYATLAWVLEDETPIKDAIAAYQAKLEKQNAI